MSSQTRVEGLIQNIYFYSSQHALYDHFGRVRNHLFRWPLTTDFQILPSNSNDSFSTEAVNAPWLSVQWCSHAGSPTDLIQQLCQPFHQALCLLLCLQHLICLQQTDSVSRHSCCSGHAIAHPVIWFQSCSSCSTCDTVTWQVFLLELLPYKLDFTNGPDHLEGITMQRRLILLVQENHSPASAV